MQLIGATLILVLIVMMPALAVELPSRKPGSGKSRPASEAATPQPW